MPTLPARACKSSINALAQAHEGVTANGAGIVLCTKSEEGNELFADAPFPVILYNDSLKAAVGKNSGMIEDEEILNTASWYVNGSFYSSWSLKVVPKIWSRMRPPLWR